MGRQRDTCCCHHVGGFARFAFGDAAQTEAMADRHLAAKTERFGASANLLDVEQAHLARLVQVDVEPDAAPHRDREDAIELALGVAVDFKRVEAADEIGAIAHRQVEQVEHAWAAHHAALRKRDDLHPHPVAIPVTRGQYALQLGQAVFVIDIDMGAQMGRATCHAFADQIAGALFGRQFQIGQDFLVSFDAAHASWASRMSHPRHAGQRLVEMHVPIDQPRQYEIAADIKHRRVVRSHRDALADSGDPAPGEADIDEAAIGQTAIGQKGIDCRHGGLP